MFIFDVSFLFNCHKVHIILQIIPLIQFNFIPKVEPPKFHTNSNPIHFNFSPYFPFLYFYLNSLFPSIYFFSFSIFFFLLPFLCFLFFSLLDLAEPAVLPRTTLAHACTKHAKRSHMLARGRPTDKCRRNTSSFPPSYLFRPSTRNLNTGGKRTATSTSSTLSNPPQPPEGKIPKTPTLASFTEL